MGITGLSRVQAALLVSAWSLGSILAGGEPPDVSLEVAGASGEPGEEVAIEFRADVRTPLNYAAANFEVSRAAAEFIRTDVAGTAAAHVAPRGIIYNPAFFKGGYMAGVRMIAQGQRSQIDPGNDLVLFRAVFRIRPDAPPGENAIRITDIEFGTITNYTASEELGAVGVLRVREPSRPRPVSNLGCAQAGGGVVLTWTPTGAADSIRVLRGGALVATLAGSATGHVDQPPLGPAVYEVQAIRGGQTSLPSACSLLVQTPRPVPISSFACSQGAGTVELSWANGAAYDSIQLLRNGQVIAELAGTAQSHADAFASDLFTVYTLRGRAGGIDTLPVSCHLNEMSNSFVLRADEVAAEPGETGVTVRVYLTNPRKTQGIQVALRIDPELARMRELSVEGTAVDAAEYDYFAYQPFYVPGETAAGIQFDIVPPFGFMLPPGADQHVLTVVVDILPSAPAGTMIPVVFGTRDRQFGRPPLSCALTVDNANTEVETVDGLILVGSSPVPGVEGARADAAGGGDGTGGGSPDGAGAAAGAIILRWANADVYTALRIERDGQPIGEQAGDSTSFIDPAPGPGIHRYRIIAQKAAAESFPVIVTTHPRGVPGTFLRGDADADGRIGITDAIGTLRYLFMGGAEPACLDGADGDDDGRVSVTDALVILHHLFRGGGALPPPGPGLAWLDPTKDELACE